MKFFTLAYLLLLISSTAFGQDMTFSEIEDVLRLNPPWQGNQEFREEAILNLDEYLKDSDAPISPDVENFYRQMTRNLASELSLPVTTGARIWKMYNHGFIVKTPSSTFAFDLINPFSRSVRLPDEVLRQIQVTFTSHTHGDHKDARLQSSIRRLGGTNVRYDNIPLQTEVAVDDLRIVAYPGLHGSVSNYIYHVTTPEGITIMHTGDTQTSQSLPSGLDTEILLINAWMNESGSRSAITGVRNGVNKISPSLTIPGHIQELGHTFNPSNPTTRVPYEWPLAVDDVPLPGDFEVMAWGEHYDYNVAEVPEPTFAMMMIGLAAIWYVARRGIF